MNYVSIFDLDGEKIYTKDPTARKGFFKGLKCVCYGDSTANLENSYINKLINIYEVDIDNKSVSGTSLTAELSRLLQENIDSYDVVIINYGINDWQASVPLYSAYGVSNGQNVKGFIESYSNFVDYILSKGKTPFAILPWYVYSENFKPTGTINNTFCDMAGYIDETIDMLEKKSINYINLYTSAGVNEKNFKTMLDGTDVWVHGTDKLNCMVAELIYSGNFNNGRCHNCTYGNIIPFTDNGFTTQEDIDNSLAGLKYKVFYGQNLASNVNNNPKSMGLSGDDEDYLTIRGVFIFNDITGFATYSITNSQFKSWVFYNMNTWRYDHGLFRFSIPLKNLGKFFFSLQASETSGFFFLGTTFYTDKAPLKLYLQDGTEQPVILENNVIFSTNSKKPTVLFNKNGYSISQFSVSHADDSNFMNGSSICKIKTDVKGIIQLNQANLYNTNIIAKTGVAVKDIVVDFFNVITSLT